MPGNRKPDIINETEKSILASRTPLTARGQELHFTAVAMVALRFVLIQSQVVSHRHTFTKQWAPCVAAGSTPATGTAHTHTRRYGLERSAKLLLQARTWWLTLGMIF